MAKKNTHAEPIRTAEEMAHYAAALDQLAALKKLETEFKARAAATIDEALSDGRATYRETERKGTSGIWSVNVGGYELSYTVTETNQFSTTEAKQLLNEAQLEACTRRATRTSYRLEAV